MSGVHGVLVVDKPRGPTSHDVVAAARRLFGTREVGHAGTLDPMATGVLVLLFGEACKLSGYLTAHDKTYRARVELGVGTDSFDADGEVVERREIADGWPSDEALERALAAERARTEQVPPALSAIKLHGERAHRASRRGAPPELAPRPVGVRRLELVGRDAHAVELELEVSKGYYVRSLARDLGIALGVPAHLSALRRLASGCFTLAEAAPWPAQAKPELASTSAAAERAMPVARLSPDGVIKARRGQGLTSNDFELAPTEPGPAAWLAPDGALVALGQAEADSHRVLRGFNVG